MTWYICTRHNRLGSTPLYPFRAIRAHLIVEDELFVIGVTDEGRVVEMMMYDEEHGGEVGIDVVAPPSP